MIRVVSEVIVQSDNRVKVRNTKASMPTGKHKWGDAVADRIRILWPLMQSKYDLLNLLNIVSFSTFGEQSHQITLHELNRCAYSSIGVTRYTTFQVPKKKKGEFRTIDAPVPELKYIQRCLNVILQTLHTPHAAAMGFVPGRSVADNAMRHLGQNYVYNIDLKDFFPSISAGRIFKRLQAKPFCLNAELASLITDLCCHTNVDGRRVLPQGAPTSPTLTNIVCERLDRKLQQLAKAYGLKYTRYADDITFSGMSNLFAGDGKFCKALRHIIEQEEHLVINVDKTRLCHRGIRQEVTGLTVNEKANVSRSYVKQLRTMLHNWEMFGYERAQEIYFSSPLTNPSSSHSKLEGVAAKRTGACVNEACVKGTYVPKLKNVLAGKLLYLKMVKGEADPTYRKLHDRYKRLVHQSKKTIKQSNNNKI